MGRNHPCGSCSWGEACFYCFAYELFHESVFSGHDAGDVEQYMMSKIIVLLLPTFLVSAVNTFPAPSHFSVHVNIIQSH